MLKERINKLFEKKGFCVVLSLLLSVVLWAYVEYVENPDTTLQINNIPVEFIGDELLTENSLLVTDKDADTVSINFIGKRNMVTRLSRQNLSVTVDLGEVVNEGAQAGVYQLSYKVNYPDGVTGVEVNDASLDYISITVEKLIQKPIDVRTTFNGDIAESFRAKDPVCSLSTIYVSGSQAIVSNVSYALATITGNGLTNTVEQEVQLTLIDIDGNEVDREQLTLSEETATVTMEVQMIKEITFAVNLVEGVSATSRNTTINYSVSSVKLAGDPEILGDINQITLGTIDLTDFAVTSSYSFPVNIPNGAENLTGVNSVTVTVEVVGQSIKRLSAKNISFKQATEGYTVTIVTQSLDILLRGPEASLADVTADNIRIVADLSSIGNAVGTFTAPATVYVDGFTDLDPIGEYKVVVTIEAQTEN